MPVGTACDDTGSDGILRQTLTVAAIGDGHVWLTGQRAAACASCAAKTGCGAGALAEMAGGAQVLRLPQTLPVAVGDRVVVAMGRSAFLSAAAKAYLLPPVALVGTAAVGLSLGIPDTVTAALCLPALGLSLLPLRRAPKPHLWLDAMADE